jgi:hypothetical protein
MTKLEQVARAIREKMLQEHVLMRPEQAAAAARAAVEALREPTEGMIRAVMMDHMDDGPGAVWGRMIDAILSEKPDPTPATIAIAKVWLRLHERY